MHHDDDGEEYAQRTLEKAAAAKFTTEQYYINYFKSLEERKERREKLEVRNQPQFVFGSWCFRIVWILDTSPLSDCALIIPFILQSGTYGKHEIA